MQIGISTAVDTGHYNWERLQDLLRINFSHFEFYNKITRIRTSDIKPLLELKKQKGINFSFHSMAQDLFCNDKVIANAEYHCLIGEIRLAALLHCTTLVFHIVKNISLTAREKNKLKTIINYAKSQNIDLCLENNSSAGPYSGDYLLKLLFELPNLYFCLDIGHLNIALKRKNIINLDQFLNISRHKIKQLHISYNDGKRDQHTDFGKTGKSYFHYLMKKIDPKDIPLIIETKDIKQALKIYNFIKYASQR